MSPPWKHKSLKVVRECTFEEGFIVESNESEEPFPELLEGLYHRKRPRQPRKKEEEDDGQKEPWSEGELEGGAGLALQAKNKVSARSPCQAK